MRTVSIRRVSMLAFALWLLVTTNAIAQQAGGISVVVRDSTGGVIPGVTVEAASAALIEKTRSVATDEAGTDKLLELPPRVYTVLFTLQGFSTVTREGIT